MNKKLRSRCGETLVETLCATAIIVMSILFLCVSAITAARINYKVQNADTVFRYGGTGTQETATIKNTDGEDALSIDGIPITLHHVGNENKSESQYTYYYMYQE